MRVSVPERLEDGVIAVRPMRTDDAAAYAAAFRDDPALGRLLGVEDDPDEASVRKRLTRRSEHIDADTRFVQFAIADAVTDAFRGAVTVHSLDDHNRRGEVGFWVTPDHRRLGIGSRALVLTISWLFEELDLLRVEMTTIPENRIVPALARRLGFTQEGVLRSRNIERGRRVDIVWFGVLREEWQGS